VAAIQKAKIVTAADVEWSNGSKFDGFILLNVARPSGYNEISLNQRRPRVVLPHWIRIPVENGAVHGDTKVLFTAEIEPPNTRYISFWYDLNNARIAGPSALFTITADPHTITPPTLTAPTAPTTGDDPDSESSDSLVTGSLFVDNETPVGTINSTTRATLQMDLGACHVAEGLDLQKLLDADTFTLIHDVAGIHLNINRETGKLEDFFLPRCAKHG